MSPKYHPGWQNSSPFSLIFTSAVLSSLLSNLPFKGENRWFQKDKDETCRLLIVFSNPPPLTVRTRRDLLPSLRTLALLCATPSLCAPGEICSHHSGRWHGSARHVRAVAGHCCTCLAVNGTRTTAFLLFWSSQTFTLWLLCVQNP